MNVQVIHGDCLNVLPTLSGLDACVCDPPYHLTQNSRNGSARNNDPKTPFGRTRLGGDRGFMGKTWDGGDIALRPETWRLVLDALKPGAHLLAFGGTRTFHRMACAIEDAGFELRDTIMWVYGQGFPKSHDVSKVIDKAAGVERGVISAGAPVKRMIPGADQHKSRWEKNDGREFVPTVTAPATPEAIQWSGWGTALKPAWEPIIVARKPLIGTVVANVLAHGTGAINVDVCRVGTVTETHASKPKAERNGFVKGFVGGTGTVEHAHGRWPANVLHDGSEEVEAAFAAFGERTSGKLSAHHVRHTDKQKAVFGSFAGDASASNGQEFGGDTGSASRFFYAAKADASDRAGSRHPTVKPLSLMRWLVRLVTPPGGTVLDPFAGSGTTGEAARLEGFNAVLIEREVEYYQDCLRRLGRAAGDDTPLFAGVDVAAQ